MYLKLTGSVMVLLSTTAFGFLIGEQFRLRVRRLTSLRQIFLMLQGEIRYHRSTLSEIFERIALKTDEPFSGWLTGMAKEMQKQDGKNFQKLWEEQVRQHLYGCGLKESDLLFLQELGGQIGYLDAQMQELVLSQAMMRMDAETAQLSGGLSDKMKLCRILGAAGGLILVIVLL